MWVEVGRAQDAGARAQNVDVRTQDAGVPTQDVEASLEGRTIP